MPDPYRSFDRRTTPAEGAGPFQFDVPDLNSGESYRLNLRDYEENGTRGYYLVISESGYNQARIINPSNQPLEVVINETNTYRIAPNTTDTIEIEGIYDIEITNDGGSQAANLSLSILREPFGSDDQARDRRTEPLARRVIRKFTGV